MFFLFCFNNSNAGNFYLLINADGGIPAVDTIVLQGNQNPAPVDFLMETFNIYPPESVRYLIIDRPTGNLLDLINQSPNWSLAQLYRTIIIEYPFDIDATPILQSLQNDSLVEHVDYTSAVLNPIVFEPEPLTSNSNSFVNIAMNSDCEEIGYPSTNIQGLTHNVNYNNQTIELEVIMEVSPSPPTTTICLYQTTDLTRYDLGVLPIGDYTLKIYKVYGNPAFPINESLRTYVGERDFQVLSQSGSIQIIPTLGFFSLLIIIILILFMSQNSIKRKPICK
ncbi:hypothetical protein MNBD_GAMMA01-1216 [hydrothermal vent metagenome]|uniref:Uncharacterized protein n=1 Tax=hydrothermal vent metagenome TaxID=652676 RepID=A0A3B0WBY3_9ZZZZ